MSRLIVGNIATRRCQQKKPKSALAEIRRKRRYFIFFNGFFKFFKICNICGGTQVLEIVIFQPSLNRF